jgi:hypothetical protein
MDTSQLIASLASSLAWPVAVVCIAVLFRAQLKTLLTEHLRHIEAGPLKADFDRIGSDVHTVLDQAGIPPSTKAGTDDLADLAEREPVVAIPEAFARVELELRNALAAINEQPSDDASAMTLAQKALEQGLISPLTINAIEGIAVMRNLAVHGPRREVTVKQAQEYLALVDSVLYAMRQNFKTYETNTGAVSIA